MVSKAVASYSSPLVTIKLETSKFVVTVTAITSFSFVSFVLTETYLEILSTPSIEATLFMSSSE